MAVIRKNVGDINDMPDEVCPACGVQGIAHGTAAGETVFRCGYCTLLYYAEEVREQTPTDLDWWEGFDEDGGRALKASLAQMGPAFGRQLATLEAMTDGRRLLDVGAGGGVFLAAARERGWDVLGLDSNQYAAHIADVVFGIEFAADLAEIPNREIDVIRLSHVLEHVSHPLDFLRELRAKLSVGGTVAVIVPNATPLTYSLVNTVRRMRARCPRLAVPMSPGFHPLGFTPRSLETVAGRAGFECLSVRSVSMGDPSYYPWFYDGLLRRVPLSEIPLRTLIRYWTPLALDGLGNRFGRGQWLVAYLRIEATANSARGDH